MEKRLLLDRTAKDAEQRLLFARVLDKYEQCSRRNLPVCTGFLSPAEAVGVQELLRAAAIRSGYLFSGGYDGAERRLLFFLPDWQDSADIESEITVLRASFREGEQPTHRDFLGSLMSLSLTRERIGDILVSETSTDITVKSESAEYLLENWTSAGRTPLRVCAVPLNELRVPQQRIRELRDTLAALRLDALVAAGFSVSRAKASELIAAGKVQKNYCTTEKGDTGVSEGDVISVRGLGKLVLAQVGGLSKKGRIGVVLHRYR